MRNRVQNLKGENVAPAQVWGNRREFLRLTATTAALFPVMSVTGASSPGPSQRKFILGAPLTHSDWMLKPGIAWGSDGVRHMLDACKDCGWSRIYWRVLDGGRALYRSKLLRPAGRWDPDSFWSPRTEADKALLRRFDPGMTDARRQSLLEKFEALDYAHFDPFAEALAYGRKIGLQIHAWVSINEDDHGWGLQSEFSKQHPQFRWRGRRGKVYRSQLSFAFPEVRAYKLAILRELLANYRPDGLFLDWIRTGDVRDNPQNDSAGVADYGYEAPLCRLLKKRFGKDADSVGNDDPDWVQLRAEPQTVFMRQVRKLVNSTKPSVPLAVLVGHPWHYRGLGDKIDGNLRGLLLDVTAWTREGLLDAAVAAGYYRDGGNPDLAAQALKRETGGRTDVWTFAWVPQNLPELQNAIQTANNTGAKQILFWEADYIDDRPNATELKAAMKTAALSPA